MTSRTLEGGCGCGAVRYRLTDRPIIVHNCFCSLCQRQSGTDSAVNAFIESDRLEQLSGSLTEHEFFTGSGKTQTTVRCRDCGTAVWSFYPRLGRNVAAIRVGTLDHPSETPPDVAIFVADKPAWAALPEGVPAFEGFYNAVDCYSDEMMGRMKAALAR